MIKSITILLVLAFLGTAVFSILAIGHELAHGTCLFITSSGTKPPCPVENPLGFTNFHINVFKSFSGFTFSGLAALALFLSIFLTMGIVFAIKFLAPTRAPVSFYFKTESPPEKIAIVKKVFWLSLHENSPTLSWTLT